MSIQIIEVLASQFMLENKDLLKDHMKEIGMGFDVEPDIDKYLMMEDSGSIFSLAAYDGDYAVGYCSMIVGPHPHDINQMCAGNDAIYVRPSYRGYAAAKLIKTAEEVSKQMGAKHVMWCADFGTKLFDTLNKHGYEQSQVVFMKEL